MHEQKIIDFHCHIFPEKVAERAVEAIGRYYDIPMYAKGTAADLLYNGRKINVCRYIVHSTATKVEQVASINDFIAETQRANREFIGFGTLHPKMEGNEIEKELERMKALGLGGIKLHPEFQGFSIDDADMMPIYAAAEGRFPILMHMGDEERTSSRPKKLAGVLDRFPGLTVVAAHLGGYRMWEESMECLMGRNLYFDTSSSLAILDKHAAAEIIRKHGVEKVLFGTDYPMWSHEDELERFYNLGLNTGERELILWKNASRLLKL